MCNKCDFACEENITHIVMQYPAYEHDRKARYGAYHALPDVIRTKCAHLTGEPILLCLWGCKKRVLISKK